MSRENYLERMKKEYFAFLDGENIIDLRKIGHFVGVEFPTNKSKGNLIEAIINVELGLTPTAPKSNRGAPIKEKNLDLDENLLKRLEDLRLACCNFGIIVNPNKPKAPLVDDPYKITFNSPDFEDEGEYYQRRQEIGQLQIYNGAHFLFPLDGNRNVRLEDLVLVNLPLIEKSKAVCGDVLCCHVREKGNISYATEILSINGLVLPVNRFSFDEEPYTYPRKKISFCESGETHSLTEKFLDVVTPVGYGQRLLATAPSQMKRKEFLSSVVKSLYRKNSVKLFVFLCETSQERIDDYKKALSEDQLVATSYDATAEDTVFAADFILNRAKRAAESGQKVCLVVDSLDYLARAHNRTVEACKSKELSFGLSLATVQYIKNYFASARAFQQFGSLTIITATEEYSGDAFSDYLTKELLLVANSIVSLKKEGMDGLIFDFTKSGTEKGKMLLTEKELETYNRISDLISEGKEKDVQKALRTCATLDDFVLRIQNI